MFGQIGKDLRFAVRTLARSPMFTAMAVVSLGLGLGSNTAIFSLLDQVLLRPLPVREPERLALLRQPGTNIGWVWGANAFSYLMYKELRERNQVFEDTIARFPIPLNLQTGNDAETVTAEIVSGNYFQVLGVGAELGRTLTPSDDVTPGGHPVVVLSHPFWKRRFGGDPRIVNSTLRINGYPMTVVGVSQPGFKGTEVGREAQVFVPVMMKAQVTPTWNGLDNRRVLWLNVIGRLKPGVSLQTARANLTTLYKPMLEQELATMPFPLDDRLKKIFLAKEIAVEDGSAGMARLRLETRTPLYILMSLVGLVLLIACANVANLLIARSAARQKEVAVRLALGAGRWALLRQLLVEAGVLAALGGLLGLVSATWTIEALVRFLPPDQMPAISTSLDGRVLSFSFALALVTGLLFGLLPAWQASRAEVAAALKDQAAPVIPGGRAWSRKALVSAQVALSMLLLAGSGLFLRSLENLRRVDVGFNTENLVTFQVDASLAGYKPDQTRRSYAALNEKLAAAPGVTAATVSQGGILTGDSSTSTINIEGYQPKEGQDMNPQVNGVGPGFFKAMGIPLLMGREFTPADAFGARKVAVVNQTFVKRFFGGENPIGRRFGFGHDKPEVTIVGVANDSKYVGLRDEPIRFVYIPYQQFDDLAGASFYVRTPLGAEAMARVIRAAVREAAPGMAVSNLITMERQIDQALMAERLVALLCTAFGVLAALLAAVGLYGVTAYSVGRRTREIGIRMALGARRRAVLGLVLREIAWLAGAGILAGLPLALGLTRLAKTFLYGLEPHDPVSLALAALLMAGVAFLAGWAPAWRAARVDPLVALRYE
jgi:predicted permease